MPGVVEVVRWNKKRRMAALLFPPLWYQRWMVRPGPPLPRASGTGFDQPCPTLGYCQDSWCRCRAWHGMAWHGVTAPVNIGGLIGWFDKDLFVYQRLGCHPLLLHFTPAWSPFLVNGRLSTLTFQRHLRVAAIFYLLGWPCRLLRGWILLLCGMTWCKGQVSRGRCGSVGNTRGNTNNEA